MNVVYPRKIHEEMNFRLKLPDFDFGTIQEMVMRDSKVMEFDSSRYSFLLFLPLQIARMI